MKTRALCSFVVLFAVASLLLSACGIMSAPPTPTNTPVPPTNTPEPTATATATFTSTPKPTITLTPTVTPNATATQRVEEFMSKVQEYYDAKYLSSIDGTYNALKDKKSSWAQIGYYQWEQTGFSPSNFIMRSDIAWRSASANANSSGCGYVFRLQDNDDHYMFFISLKGYVEMATNTNNSWKSLGKGNFGNPSQNGKANVSLIAENDTFRVLVNDKLVKTYSGFAGKLITGELAYTVVSGINTSFGTECQFTNTELWTINKK